VQCVTRDKSLVAPRVTKVKLLLDVFEQLSGLKINYHKSDIFCFGQARECEEQYLQLFGCKLGQLPFKYLGIPMHVRRLLNKDWKVVDDN
jgi:hypothetical protein